MRNYNETAVRVTTGNGYLRATTLVEVTDIFGMMRTRNVNIGRVAGVSLDEAQRMVEKARENNPAQNVQAVFQVSL